jgi:hypothetical protein
MKLATLCISALVLGTLAAPSAAIQDIPTGTPGNTTTTRPGAPVVHRPAPSETTTPATINRNKLRLAPVSVCTSNAATKAEAIDECAPKLQCQPPKTTKCGKGTPGQPNYICRCGT